MPFDDTVTGAFVHGTVFLILSTSVCELYDYASSHTGLPFCTSPQLSDIVYRYEVMSRHFLTKKVQSFQTKH